MTHTADTRPDHWFATATSYTLHRKAADGDFAVCSKRIKPRSAPKEDGGFGITYRTDEGIANWPGKICADCPQDVTQGPGENASQLARAATGEDLLQALASIPPEDRQAALLACRPRILRQAADLCGIGDAELLAKKAAVKGILANF